MHRASALYSPGSEDDAALLRRYGSIIDRAARKVARRANGYITPDDLWSAGALGLLEAARRFDASRAVRFETFVEHRVRGAMLDELRKQDHLPRRLRDDSDSLTKARATLAHNLGRDPTLDELAENTGLDVETIANIDAVAQPPIPLVDDLPIAAEAISAEEEVQRKELAVQLAGAITKLPSRHALILSLHYVEELTYKEIAAILEVSEARVCQLHADALKKVRGTMQEEGE